MGRSAIAIVMSAVLGVSGFGVEAPADPAPKNPDWPPAPLVSDFEADPELTAAVLPFAEAWYDCSSHCAQAKDRLAFLYFPIEYIGPARTVRTEAEEFAEFAKSRASFAKMDHEIQTLAASGDRDEPVVDVTLRFSGEEKESRRRFAYAIHQQLQLVRGDGSYKIVKYYILGMDPA